MAHLTSATIDWPALVQAVGGPSRGGLAVFLGTVRDHHAGRTVVELEYCAYGPMAEATLAAVIGEAKARWPVTVGAQHRVGRLALGDVAVAVAVGADHREAAFAACRWVIEELKARVPIWKRERYADGSEAWVDPTAPAGIVPSGPSS